MLQTSVGTVATLGRKSHRGTVATTGTGRHIIGSTGVPGKANQDGAIAAIVIVVIFLETGGHFVVDLLVVCLGGLEDLGGGGT